MKSTQKGLIVPLLIAIVGVLVIGGGIYYYNKTHCIGCTPLPKIDSNVDQTVLSKTYSNTRYGFVLKYPSDFDVYANSYIEGDVDKYNNNMRASSGTENIISVGKVGLVGKNKYEALFSIGIQDNTGNKYQTTDQLITDYSKISEKNSSAPIVRQMSTKDGLKMVEILYPDSKTVYMLINNNNFYTVTAGGSNTSPLSTQDRELIRNILSSLVFNG